MPVALGLSVGQLVHHFGTDWNISPAVCWIAMQFDTYHIHDAHIMNPTDFGDPVTFHYEVNIFLFCLYNYLMDCHDMW